MQIGDSHKAHIFPPAVHQDGVDTNTIFDSTDLDQRSARGASLMATFDRICANYQQAMDVEGVTDAVVQVT